METTSWTPIKISRRKVRPVDSTSVSNDDEDIPPDNCLSLSYQPVDGVPGMEIETADEVFWAPIAHRTRGRLKSTDT